MPRNLFLILICLILFNAPSLVRAETCNERSKEVLFHSCDIPANVSLKFFPLEFKRDRRDILSITGAYSSGDRFGVEGLAFKAARLISLRFKGWDGALLISPNGNPQIHNVENIQFLGHKYNLKNISDRRIFIEKAQDDGWSMIQSHLLITDSVLDLLVIPNARQFIRRMFFTDLKGWGIYETKTPVTLYEAALEIQKNLNPYMVINLDMGAYNYCQINNNSNFDSCGDLLTSHKNLTNLITIRLLKNN